MIKHDHFIKVYYRDVDQMGIVYYTRYLEYFEEARTELLDALGLSISSIEEGGMQLPVITSHCEYKLGANLEDKLLIETSIKQIPKATLSIDYSVQNSLSGQILVTGYTKHAFIDMSGNPKRVPKFILDKIISHF
ncbi:MAG: thioesterase family protein [Candidatus Marinimicrobia bacterium]|nr:thioesterase family protein [Candidatus Neomarinimicrobiota bacterium]